MDGGTETPDRPWRSRIVRALVLLVVLCVMGAFAWWWPAARLVAENLVRPRNRSLNVDPEIPEAVDHHFRVARPDEVEIDVWVLEARAPRPEQSVDTLLVFHGISDQKRTMLSLARRFALAGTRAVLMDFRGHGASTETQITFGVREREDVSAVLDALEARHMPVGDVGIYGPSFGGAVAIQVAGSESRVKRVVTVASFASMRSIVGPYVADTWGPFGSLVPSFVIDGLVDRAGEVADFDPDEASPERLITQAEAEILLIHSPADEIVPYEHAERMRDACGSNCRLLTLENLSHLRSMSNVPLRLESYRHLIGEEFPGDTTLEARAASRE